MAARQDLTFFAGETWQLWIYATGWNGDALAITDLLFRVMSATQVVIDMSAASVVPGGGVSLLNAALGQASVVVPPASQGSAPAGVYAWQARAVLSNGALSDQAYGTLTVRPSLFDQFAFVSPGAGTVGELDGTDPGQAGWTLGH